MMESWEEVVIVICFLMLILDGLIAWVSNGR